MLVKHGHLFKVILVISLMFAILLIPYSEVFADSNDVFSTSGNYKDNPDDIIDDFWTSMKRAIKKLIEGFQVVFAFIKRTGILNSFIILIKNIFSLIVKFIKDVANILLNVL